MSDKPFAPATERNQQAILGVIKEEFRDLDSILEIGSGTGQHAVFFGAELGHLTWQTSDVTENHPGIHAWLGDAALSNVLGPLALDVLIVEPSPMRFDAVFSANTAHIMSAVAVEKMFGLVSSVLNEHGIFVLYGPFLQNGKFNTKSNADFHEALRQRDPSMGIRNLEDLDRLAGDGGMRRVRLYALPANNHIVVWTRVRNGAKK